MHARVGEAADKFESDNVVDLAAVAMANAGVTAQLNRTISAYASAGYTTSVDSTRRDDITGRFGLRVSWQ